MRPPKIRVLVVDDSAFARKVLREILTTPDVEVVGIARDGLEALEKVAELKPDVVTLDLRMPDLDGTGFLRALPADGAPRVLVVTTSEADGDIALEALAAGAVDIIHKPTALASERLYEISSRLVEMVRAAATARPAAGDGAGPAAEVARPAPRAGTVRLVAIGASTGGPQAVTRILRVLPASFPVPVAVVIHMPPGYTASLAERLDNECEIDVVEASDGLVLRPGLAVVARGGMHLKVREDAGGGLRAHLDLVPIAAAHRPAVDVLFETAAAALGRAVLGVVLTGMGDDGLVGARAIRAAGGVLLAEAESSCVVYGMPRCVYEAGLASGVAPIQGMAAEIARRL